MDGIFELKTRANEPREVKLWRAVLMQGVDDALWRPARYEWWTYQPVRANTGYKSHKRIEKHKEAYVDVRDQGAVNWIKSESCGFNSFLNLCEMTNANERLIRKLLNLPPKSIYEHFKRVKRDMIVVRFDVISGYRHKTKLDATHLSVYDDSVL